jgi:hypothetical protein
MALGRVAFMGKRFEEAEKWYDHIAKNHPTHAAEAMYWRAVCQYNSSHDPAPLMQVAQDLRSQHGDSLWATKSSVWLPAEATTEKVSVL